MNRHYLLKTLGCKSNYYDSLLIEQELQRAGWKNGQNITPTEMQSVELCIINSCTVTDEADRQSRKLASRFARQFPKSKVVVTGCAAEIDSERLLSSNGIHYVIGNRDKPKLVTKVLSLLENQTENKSLDDFNTMNEWPDPETAFAFPKLSTDCESSRTRSFVKIQEGCNRFCTFCIIPYARGPSRSLGVQSVVSRIQSLVTEGVQEVVLTGTNLGDFGTDGEEGESLLSLLKAIFQDTDLQRLRLSSLDPSEIPEALLHLMENEPRFCPHFHISLQSPHSRILRRMKRPYGFEQVKKTLLAIEDLRIALPGGAFVGMDVITGFPGETDEDFAWTREAFENLPWHRLHVFPYSERAGTPATRISGVLPQAVREERAKILRKLSYDRLKGHYESVLQSCQTSNLKLTNVLLEGATKGPEGAPGFWSGYTPNYLKTLLEIPPVFDKLTMRNKTINLNPTQVFSDFKTGDASFKTSL